MDNTSKLTELIIDERIAGKSYYDIGIKHEIDPIEALELVKAALNTTSIEDEWEQRGITMLRLERVIEYMWEGVKNGSFKHAEVLIKSADQLSNLLALNKEILKEKKAEITDAQAALIYMVISENNRQMLAYINDQLKPNKRQMQQLESWPQVSAESATQAVEIVLYAEEEDEDV